MLPLDPSDDQAHEPGFLRLATTSAAQLALSDGARALTWAELRAALEQRTAVLTALVRGDEARMAVMGENTMETVLTYAAAMLAGIGTIPVNVHLKADELGYILGDGHAAAVWADGAHRGEALRAAAAIGDVPVIASGGPLPEGLDWDALVSATAAVPQDLGRPAGQNLAYTSGTTGFPKGVLRRLDGARSVREVLWQLARHYAAGLGPHLVAGPLHHSGPHASIGLLLAGTPVVVPGRFDAATALSCIDRFSVASSVMVPTHFVRLLGLPDEVREAADVSSLRVIGQTGAACPVEVKRAMIRWFGPVFRESYGATESGILTVITSDEWLRKPGSVGRPVPPFEVLVVDEAGVPVPTGSEGRLYFHEPSGRGIEYLDAPEKSAAAHLAPGLFTLGEVGYVDCDGYVYITDRFSDMVVSGGVNIYPAECERVLLEHPAVADAAVYGVADPETGERLSGAVVVRDREVSAAQLIEHCRARLAHYKVPRTLHIVAELPRSAMGKLEKRRLRSELG